MLIRRKKAPLKQGEEPNMTSHPDPGKKSKKKGGIWPLRRRSSFKRSSSRFGAAPAEDELIQTVDSLSSSKVSPQVKVIYDKFSDDPHAVLKVQCDDDEYQELMMSEDDQVVVQVEASTITHNDVILRRGMDSGLNSLLHLPATPGYDVVGRIVSETETGDFKRGDRVAALLRTGGNARYAVVHTNSLVKVPPSVDSTDAACMASIYMTAYQAFKRAVAHITQNKERSGYDDYLLRNKKVLITGGMGPVSQALIELCQRTGGDVYCTAPKKSHSVLKRQMHVVNVLPPAPQDWLPLVKDQMDIVFDGQCQDGFESPHAALKQTDEKSVLICIGTHGLLNSEEANALCGTPLSAMWATTKASWFMDKTEFYNVWSSFQDNPDQYKSDLEHIFGMLSRGEISPAIDRICTLHDVADAHAYIEQGRATGALVCLPWENNDDATTDKRGMNRLRKRRNNNVRIPHVEEADERDEWDDTTKERSTVKSLKM